MILDGAALAERTTTGAGADPRSFLLACYPGASIPPLTHVVETAAPLVARVNHGRWIASCSCGARKLPSPGCLVFLDNLLGWCLRCGNQAWGGGWRRVVAPDADERARIEAVLECRPNVEDRNWEVTETLDDLIADNIAHGDPIPDLGPPVPVVAAETPAPLPWPTEAGRAILRALRRPRPRWLGR